MRKQKFCSEKQQFFCKIAFLRIGATFCSTFCSQIGTFAPIKGRTYWPIWTFLHSALDTYTDMHSAHTCSKHRLESDPSKRGAVSHQLSCGARYLWECVHVFA